MKKAIIFDLDDTLLWDAKSVKEAFKATCEVVRERYGVDPELFEEKVRERARQLYAGYDTYAFTQEIGINPFEGLWGNFNDEGKDFNRLREIVPQYKQDAWTLGLKDIGVNDIALGKELANTFPEMRKRHPYVYEETFEVLDELKNNYPLVLLTNGSPELQYTKLDITPELQPYFEHIVISGAFGRGKPDVSIFMHLLELLSLKKEQVLMVGDNLHTDILGASKAGIDSVWVNRNGKEKNNEIVPTYEISSLREIHKLL
ncbi:HAD family hydrolase [Virgibacillus halodenitrificans]|uniref:HAD family hydrolase n=1 Tax=Virgibacillus halodenitrificans TaxID=1482 RepID=UPI00045C47D3|nr:HAD family hydrolase [Virgibacillus halodenitrificans]CDQ32147.1 Pyrimidine 5'-nucleotidase YjjG [Virgibacillus halodenitrificans]